MPNADDEYFQMSERTARDCLFHFNKCIISLYMVDYLRKPTLEDVENIYNKHLTTHGFSGMLGSIDYMHWEWKNCPVLWQGQYGANNDTNVLDNSSLFDDLLDDKAHVAPYVVNGVEFEKSVDGLKGVKLNVEKIKKYETDKCILVFNETLWSIFGKKLNTKMKTFSRL
nr:hypothetical protein [Tanacetum cinerariifolium]